MEKSKNGTAKQKMSRRKLIREPSSSDSDVIYDKMSCAEESPDDEPSTSEEIMEVITPKSRKRTAPEAPVDTFSAYHFKNDNTSAHMPYVPNRWTPQSTYRMAADVILDTIRKSGTEGLGRAELGQTVGYDATTKTGGRKVTNWIVSCTNEHPDHIGQFQKMNGKVRTIRYFWKESEQPERFEKLLREFHELTNTKCPFKIGEVLKFPEKKLNTLRISDVTLKRFNRIIRMANAERVIVTINKLIKMIYEEEQEEGYKYQIDKKSVLKCLFALQNKGGYVRVFETTVKSENVNYQIQIVTHGSIKRSDDPEIRKGIDDILDSYHKEGRVFPHGQLRFSKKNPEEVLRNSNEFDNKIEDIDEDLTRARTIKDRYHFFRVQTLRNSWKGKNLKDNSVDPAEEEDGDVDDGLDETHQKDATVTEEEDKEEEDKEAEETEEDPNEAMVKLFAKNPAVPTPNKKSNQFYFGKDSLGYQEKSIRLLVLHEMAYHFVHGHPNEASPTNFDLFPPTQAFDKWQTQDENTAHVFYDEESPYRFMPPQAKYKGVDRGWFMMQDFLAALPLSVFVLASYVPRSIDHGVLMSYLQDPIKRHLCIGYLPVELREILMKEKKVHKQLQHAFFFLGGMRLAGVGPNPSVKRFPGAVSEMIYIATRTHLYDTSTSARGYACVNPPVEDGTYVKHEYNFESRLQVIMFWHHLRAIVHSTPLSYRVDDIGDQKNCQMHKQYSIGVFDRRIVEQAQHTGIAKLDPHVRNDGVAGFDSALFIHLKRHWDLCSIPQASVGWFVAYFKRCSDKFKKTIEENVKSVHKDWNNFTRLSLSDADFVRSSNQLMVEYPPKAIKKFGGASKPKSLAATSDAQRKLPTRKRPKKRKLDSVDLVSSSARVSVRCRFTPKERDQLIMIRAVGFFLNPVYRFWLDPTVLRDLMHEFVPESRNKTVQSLMACGVRELVRANRLAYLQRIVKNLSTFPEMRRLRSELCSTPVSPGEKKTEFFKNAFRVAMRLLFVDNNRIPSTSITDADFRVFLKSGNVSVTKEITVSNACPRRSQKPISYGHIQHCVAANILISVLVHSKNGEVPEKMLEQVPPAVLQSVLQSLRSDGLVSRSRTLEAVSELTNKKDATLSYYFRHFFSHRFHSELVEGTGRLMEEVESIENWMELEGDGPEVIVAACNTFYHEKYHLEMQVDNDILEAFSNIENDQTKKKIRDLESADLHFEKIRVMMDRPLNPRNLDPIYNQPDTFNAETKIQQVLEYFQRNSRAIQEESERVTLDDFIQINKLELQMRRETRAVCHVIKSSRQVGITFKDLSHKVKIPPEEIEAILNKLNEARLILPVGVDEKRWVSREYEACWTVRIGDRRWCPRPWISSDGKISLPVVRWMAESVLLLIVGKLGIQLKDVITTYEFAVQPITIREIVTLLEELELIEIIEKSYQTFKLSSPFSTPSTVESIIYVLPSVDALEKFSKIFHKVDLLSTMTSKPT